MWRTGTRTSTVRRTVTRRRPGRTPEIDIHTLETHERRRRGGLRDGYRRAQPGVPTVRPSVKIRSFASRVSRLRPCRRPRSSRAPRATTRGPTPCSRTPSSPPPTSWPTRADSTPATSASCSGDPTLRVRQRQVQHRRARQRRSRLRLAAGSPWRGLPGRWSGAHEPHARGLQPRAPASRSVNSLNPADDWRELSVLNDWVLPASSCPTTSALLHEHDGRRAQRLSCSTWRSRGARQLNNGSKTTRAAASPRATTSGRPCPR